MECDDAYTKTVNYFVLCLSAYKAVAETIYDRFINVYIFGQVIKPLISNKKNGNLKWTQIAIRATQKHNKQFPWYENKNALKLTRR